jgi:predicted nucleotidyltransferase
VDDNMPTCNYSIIEQIRKMLADRPEIDFAYVHGSVIDHDAPRDIDLAIHLHEEAFARLGSGLGVTMDFAIPLEILLETEIGMAVDVQVLNSAPLSFRARVVSQGRTLIDHDPVGRADFEYRSRYEYFDFRPRRQEYLAGVMA